MKMINEKIMGKILGLVERELKDFEYLLEGDIDNSFMVINTYPKSPSDYIRRSYMNFMRGNIELSLNELEEAVKLENNSRVFYAWRCYLNLLNLNYNNAKGDADIVVNLAPGNYLGYFLRSYVNLMSRNYNLIDKDLEFFNKYFPVTHYVISAWSNYRTGKYREAIQSTNIIQQYEGTHYDKEYQYYIEDCVAIRVNSCIKLEQENDCKDIEFLDKR